MDLASGAGYSGESRSMHSVMKSRMVISEAQLRVVFGAASIFRERDKNQSSAERQTMIIAGSGPA